MNWPGWPFWCSGVSRPLGDFNRNRAAVMEGRRRHPTTETSTMSESSEAPEPSGEPNPAAPADRLAPASPELLNSTASQTHDEACSRVGWH